MNPRRVVIAGGGVGGMTLAAALGRLGIPHVVLERAPRLGEVGSGLGILPGAVRALEAIGVDASLFRQAAPFRRFVVSTSGGRDLASVSFTRIFEAAGRPGYVMHRGALHAAIAARVDPAVVRTGSEVVAVECGEGAVRAYLRGVDEPVVGDVLVGADGLRSCVREHVLHDGPPRYAGETIFRGIADFALDAPDVCREMFGRGRRAAYYELGPGRVYWWATAPLPEGTRVPRDAVRAHLRDAFAGWAFGLPEMLECTPTDRILQNDIYDRPPVARWHRGPVGLLGDAAHPTTPNLGQGACMAIEDGVVLARCLGDWAMGSASPEQAFRSFHAARRRRCGRTVRLSRWWGNAGLLSHPLPVALRDAALGLGRGRWLERGGAAQYVYDPGGLPGH